MSRARQSRKSLQSLKDLERGLTRWVKRVRRKVVKSAVNAAATPVLREARKLAPVESGLLRESLKGAKAKKVLAYKAGGLVQAIVGPSRQVSGEHRGKRRVPANYAHLVEFGHLDRGQGFVAAKPFLRPAFDRQKGAARRIFIERCRKGMAKEAAKR